MLTARGSELGRDGHFTYSKGIPIMARKTAKTKGGATKKAVNKKPVAKKTASKKTAKSENTKPVREKVTFPSKDRVTHKQLVDRALVLMDKGDYDPIRRTQANAFMEALSDAVQEFLEDFKVVPLFKAGDLVTIVPTLRAKRVVRVPFTDPPETKKKPAEVIMKVKAMKNAKESAPSVQKAQKRLRG